MNNTTPFNNPIEIGLRSLCILNEIYPTQLDVQSLIYIDYIIIHSGDFDSSMKSLHIPVPYRKSEIYIRRKLIQDSLNFFIKRALIEISYSTDGIRYVASEKSSPFIENLSENYTNDLLTRINWFIEKYNCFTENELKKLFEDKVDFMHSEFNLGILK